MFGNRFYASFTRKSRGMSLVFLDETCTRINSMTVGVILKSRMAIEIGKLSEIRLKILALLVFNS